MIRRGVFESYELASPLHLVNPAVKLLCSLAVMLFVSLIFDIPTLSTIAGWGLLLVLGLARVRPTVLARAMLPFAIFGLGFLWMNAILPRAAEGQAEALLRLGPLTVWREGLLNGISFAIRALSFGVYSVLFVATTDPTTFVLSLIHQLRVPPRLAYSALAAYRYLPTLHAELAQIRAAHRLRGVGETGGLRGKLQQAYRYTIPLLAAALRRAGRTANAMEARAFTGRQRTWYRTTRLRAVDAGYALLALGGVAAIVVLSARAGTLMLWSGRLWV